MEKELLSSVAQSQKILLEVYRDLAKPGVQQVGKALSTVLGLGNTLLWPIHLMNEKSQIALESNLERYRAKLEHVPEEDICPVAPEVGVPIAEKLSYVTNETISDMYLELLARASLTQSANVAHPSFANIIENLSPDEAMLLQTTQHQLDGIPFVELRFQQTQKNTWITLQPMLLQEKYYAGLTYPGNLYAYVSNLEGLGIFDVQGNIYLDLEEIYTELEELGKSSYSSFTAEDRSRKLTANRGRILITGYGRLFLTACFSNKGR